MKYNKILELILIIFSFSYINCKVAIRDITIDQPIQLATLLCNTQRSILMVDDEFGMSGIIIKSADPTLTYIKDTTFSNDTAVVFIIDLNLSRGSIYNETIDFFNILANQSNIYQLYFKCEDFITPPPSNIQLQDLSNGFKLDIFGKYSMYFYLKDLSKIVSVKYEGSTTFGKQVFSNYGCISYDFIQNFTNLNQSQYSTIYYNLTYKDITTTSSFDYNSYFDIGNISLYPSDNPSTITPIGFSYLPVFTFSINTLAYGPGLNSYIPFFYQMDQQLFYRPISSRNGKSIYIGYFTNSEQTVYFQKNNQIVPFISSTSIINEKQFASSLVSPVIQQVREYIVVSSSYIGTSNPFTFTPLNIQYGDNVQYFSFPFGYSGGNNLNFQFDISILKNIIIGNQVKFNINSFIGGNGVNLWSNYNQNIQPGSFSQVYIQYKDAQFIQIFDHTFILRIKRDGTFDFKFDKWILKYKKEDYNSFIVSSLDVGAINSTTYDLIINQFYPIQSIYPNEYSFKALTQDKYYNIIGPKYFSNPKFNNKDFDIYNIAYIKMLYSEINVTNKSAGNILYFKYDSIDIKTPIALFLYDPINKFNNPINDLWYATFNQTLKMFQIEFFVKANSHPGPIPYALMFNFKDYIPNSVLPESAQFNVISKNEDLSGPIIDILSNQLLNLTSNPLLLWRFNILDEINGFRNGYITIRSSIDGSLYNFTLEAKNNNIFNGSYVVSIDLSGYYYTSFIITECVLFDQQGINSTYSIANPLNSPDNSFSNPFIKYLNNPNALSTPILTSISFSDTSKPELLSIDLISGPSDQSPLDVGSHDRVLQFQVIARDSESGLRKDQIPIIYLEAYSMRFHQCQNATIKPIDEFSKQYSYYCSIPLGFGFGYGIYIHLYNLINNAGIYSGYSSYALESLQTSSTSSTFIYKIPETSFIMSNDYPSIRGSNRVRVDDNQFWIYGRGFSSVAKVSLSFINSDNSNSEIPLVINQNLQSALHLTIGSNKIQLSAFSLTFTFKSNKVYQDPYIIIPIERVNLNQELPVNPDQQCKGSPVCGGPSKGYCSKSGCICYSPFIGDDCSSRTIVVPQPNVNTSEPSTGIEVGGEDNSGSDSNSIGNIIYKSFISLVSLREINVEGVTIQEKRFENWKYDKLSNNVHQYQTNITSTLKVKATLEWFDKSTNISFANQELTMNPSSIKYTIDIENYPFESQLNSLELIMSASLESTKTDNICSSQQFGNTSNSDNSNYMKIQVEDHSLYGRFIKRGVFDYYGIRSVSNRLIKSNITNTEYSSNTLIAIQMGYFSSHATIDPDFSIILNSNTANTNTNSENVVCSKLKGSNKLTGARLAGVIIGVVGFVAVIIISVSYHFIRKRNQKEYLTRIQTKLEQFK